MIEAFELIDPSDGESHTINGFSIMVRCSDDGRIRQVYLESKYFVRLRDLIIDGIKEYGVNSMSEINFKKLVGHYLNDQE